MESKQYKQRVRELKTLFGSLDKPLRDYLYFGEHLLPVPKTPIGCDYEGDLSEVDQRRMLEARENRYPQIKINLDRLCLELSLDKNEFDKAAQYAVEVLGI